MLTRFAPSPTGYIHLGNARTALLCYLFAKHGGGDFMLRVDDTDAERSEEEYVDALKEDLQWLGLNWDKTVRQSERFEEYNKAIEKLKEAGRLYPCYETAEELDVKRKMQLKRGMPPLYDRSALKLTDEQKQELEAKGVTPHWRFKLDAKVMEWDDAIRGRIYVDTKHISDPVLVRANGMLTYMLPSTVDDIELGVTHVIRGEDHISNTGVQMQIFEALGGDLPVFAHNALIKTKEGKLSKRSGKNALRDLKAEGIDPLAITAFLAKIGTSDPVEADTSLEKLVAEFDISKFGKSSTMYEVEDIWRLNTKMLHEKTFAEVKPELDAMGLNEVDEGFWSAVRPNIDRIEEVKDWWVMCNQPIKPEIEDADFTNEAAVLLPEGVVDENTWKIWIDAVKAKTDRKGKALFMPIRKALTGKEHGPELHALLPLLGREKIIARLKGEQS